MHGCACSFACVHERFVRCACDVRAFALVRCADRTSSSRIAYADTVHFGEFVTRMTDPLTEGQVA